MTLKQLFQIEDYLSVTGCLNTHIEIKDESTIKEAFGETFTIDMDDVKVKGLYIVIFPDDDDDARDIRKGLKTILSLYDIDANLYVFRYMRTADFRIAIEVEKYK